MNLKVDVRGERCSGTNYLYSLLKKNFSDIVFASDFGWKHDFLDIRTPKIYEQQNYLIFIVFRNPYDWVQSLYKNPHHIHPKLRDKPFSEFIRSEWCSIIEGFAEYEIYNLPVTQELFIDRNPINLEKIKNIFELRNLKNTNFLSYKNIFNNCYYLNIEILQKNWENILHDINNKFFNIENFTPKNEYYYKGQEKYGMFNHSNSQKLNNSDLSFMIEQLDWKIEHQLNYNLIDVLDKHTNN